MGSCVDATNPLSVDRPSVFLVFSFREQLAPRPLFEVSDGSGRRPFSIRELVASVQRGARLSVRYRIPLNA